MTMRFAPNNSALRRGARQILKGSPTLPALFGGVFSICVQASCLAPDAVPGGEGGAGGTSSTNSNSGGLGEAGYTLSWAKSYGVDGDYNQRAFAAQVTAENNILVAGEFESTLTLDPLPTIPNTVNRDGFVALLSPEGDAQWALAFAGPGDQKIQSVLQAPDGKVIVAGSFFQNLIVDATDLAIAPMGREGFIAAIGANQKVDWIVQVTGENEQSVHSIAIVGNSPESYSIAAVGIFQGALTVGTVSGGDTADGDDFYVSLIANDGTVQWARSLGGDPPDLQGDKPACVVSGSVDGSVYAAGSFSGTVQLGQNLGALGMHDLFIGRFDSMGEPVWGTAVGSADSDHYAADLAVDSSGKVALVGDIRGKANFGDGTVLTSDGNWPDAVLAIYTAEGKLSWARRYGSQAEDHGSAIAFTMDGGLLFGGEFRGSITFGKDEALNHNSAIAYNDDLFIAKLTANGAPLFQAAYGGEGNQVMGQVAYSATGDIVFAGWNSGQVDFGDGELDAAAGDNIFVTKLVHQ
ncbi:MAG: hypothetical protein IPK82_15910 [Polyangiaceae bacterium]|nr:hypothetical protein [Polyangiaceae bacterium]